MKILFISWFPPSPRFSGSGLRTFHTLRALASCGQVTLLAPVQDRHRPLLEDCKPWCEEVVAPDLLSLRTSLWPTDQRTRWEKYCDAIGTLEPVAARYYDSSEFSRMVRDVSRDTPDLIWIYSSWLTGCLPHLDWQKVVVDFDTLFFRAMRRAMRHTPWYGSKILLEGIEAWKQERFDRRLAKRAAQVLVCSEEDRRILGYDNVRVLPNCVDMPPDSPSELVDDHHRLLFIGKMDYEPNIDAARYFCKSILPHIREVEPRAHVYIVGREPSEEIRALHTGTDVFITGAVPDATPHFNAASIVVVPIRFGGGTRIKILEAFAHRKAVVSTTIGSEGLRVQQGVHLYRADTPHDFAVKCLALMKDNSMRRNLGMAGRELVESHYSQDVFQRAVHRCVSAVAGSA